MKNRTWLPPAIAIVLLVLVTLGCGASAQANAPKSVKSSGAEFIPTDAPVKAPAKLPDMSSARIFRQQLPGGFEEIPMDGAENGGMLPSNEEYLPELVFAYINKKDFQIIIGMNFLLVSEMKQIGFNAILKDSDTLKEFAGAMGGENIREETLIETLVDLGEKRSAMTMLADVESIPMRVNVAVFQRGVIGGVIISMATEGKEAKISFEKLVQLFDQRVQETLERTH